MAKISVSFLAVAGKAMFNKSEWKPVGVAYTLEEIWEAQGINYGDIEGDEATVTEVEFSDGSTSLRISVPMKDGSTIDLHAGKAVQNNLDEGDKIKVNLIYGQELRKAGQPSIVRYEAWETEEDKAEYLKERDGK